MLALLGFSCVSAQPVHSMPYKVLGSQGILFFVVGAQELASDETGLRTIAAQVCRNMNVREVIYWVDESRAGGSLPMTDAQVLAEVAVYNLNKATGYDEMVTCARDGC